jgi:Tol biopolymer transport system component
MMSHVPKQPLLGPFTTVRLSFALIAALVIALAGGPPASAVSRSASAANRIPPTVMRTGSISMAGLALGTRGGAIRAAADGSVTAARRTALAPGTMCAPIRFTEFGIAWTQGGSTAGAVSATVRVGPGRSSFGPATTVQDDQWAQGPDQSSIEYHATQRATEPLWVGDGRCVRFTLTLPAGVTVSNVHTVYINTLGTAFGGPPVLQYYPRANTLSSSGASPSDQDSAPEPDIITRAEWGANENLINCFYGYAAHLTAAFIHHTAGTNDYSKGASAGIVRGIYAYHTNVHHWCDIGYNFLVDKYGQIFEGREGGVTQPVIPAAQKGFNTSSVAVSAMGNYQTATPSSAMLSSIEDLLAWRFSLANIDPTGSTQMVSGGGQGNRYPKGKVVTLKTISAHRDVNFTTCPGDKLYGDLGTIRSATAGRISIWSGGHIEFTSDRTGSTQIYSFRANGAELKQLTAVAGGAIQPARSLDGSKVAFAEQSGSDTEIYTMNSDGTNVQQITSQAGFNGYPAWSPGGTQIAFVSDRGGSDDVYTMSASGANVTQITYKPGVDTMPAWSPLGTHLAFASDRSGNMDIYTIPLGGGKPAQKTEKAATDTAPSWSPVGGQLAFQSDRTGNWDVFTMEITTLHMRQMTFKPGSDTAPSWSPDGGFLSFASDRTGQTEIFTIGLNTAGVIQLTAEGNVNDHPSWSN